MATAEERVAEFTGLPRLGAAAMQPLFLRAPGVAGRGEETFVMQKSKPVSKVPNTLLNRSNALFLIGRRFWDHNFFEGLELCLQQWIKEGGDYIGLLNDHPDLELPSMVLLDTPIRVKIFENKGIWINGRHENPSITITFQDYPDEPQKDIQIPIKPLLYDHESISGKYVVYLHYILNMENNTEFNSDAIKHMPKPSATGLTSGIYTGITRKGWDIRFAQHLSAANCGSGYHFHRALRGSAHLRTIHQVHCWDATFEDAMEVEEELVEKHSLWPRGLNMIPGGFAGIRYLATHGFKMKNNRRGRRNWEHRERTIAEFNSYCSRAGRPNPLAAANWKNDAYAASVILGRTKTFSLENVRTIRKLHESGFGAHDIATRMMVNVGRIHRLLRGATYRRVH